MLAFPGSGSGTRKYFARGSRDGGRDTALGKRLKQASGVSEATWLCSCCARRLCVVCCTLVVSGNSLCVVWWCK